jgi:hypothetical protein
MKISSKMFKYLALAGAIVASAAYAQNQGAMCGQTCSAAAQQASDAARTSITQQMYQSCGQIADSTARNQCFLAVPTEANKQASQVYTSVYNSCMGSCMAGGH